MLKPFQSSLLSSHSHLKHGFFTREGGVSLGPLKSLNMRHEEPDPENNFEENCRRVCNWFQLPPSQLILLQQIHGNTVHWVDDHNASTFLQGDGLITQKPGLILGVRTADCIPVLLYDPISLMYAAVHVGWRGAMLNILAETLKQMAQRGAHISEIYAALGPCIQVKSFEVDQQVYHLFHQQNQSYTSFFKTGKDQDHFWLDLPGLAMFQLKALGVVKMDSLGLDTYRDEQNFFSYRRMQHLQQKIHGIQLSAITLS